MEWSKEHYSDIYEEKLSEGLRSPYYLELRLRHAIKDGDEELAIKILKDMNRFPKADLGGDELRSSKNSMICSCTFFARATIEAGVLPKTAFDISDDCIRTIERLENKDDVLNFEEKMLRRFTEVVSVYLHKRYPDHVIKVMHYVDSNLSKDISLKSAAEYVHVNPNYLSNVFKEKTGETFTEYTNRQKVVESSYFVGHTSYELSDITYLYKFCNQAYFSRLFKQYMGITPGKYRKNYEKQKL